MDNAARREIIASPQLQRPQPQHAQEGMQQSWAQTTRNVDVRDRILLAAV